MNRFREAGRWVPAVLAVPILGMGLYTALATALMAYRTYTPVIYWDQWEYVEIALHAHGWPSWSRLWAQYSEHRTVIGRLAGFIDLHYFGGRNISLLIELYLVAIGLAVVFIWTIWRFSQLRGAALVSAAGFVTYCIFCPVEIDNFTWGVQVGFVLSGLAAMAAFSCGLLHASRIAADKTRWISWPLILSLFAAFLAECSMADGVLVWPILVILSFVLHFTNRSRILIAGAGTAVITAYFWHYRPSPDHASPLQTIIHPIAIARYVIAYFATTWNSEVPAWSVGFVASLIGTMLAILFALALIARHLIPWRRSTPDLLRTFLAALLLFSLLAAYLTSLGRLDFGVAQASANRYQCVALLFWASLVVYVLTWAASRQSRAVLVTLQTGLLALMVASAMRYHSFEEIAAVRRVRLARAYIAVTRNPDDRAAAAILNPATVVPSWCAWLRANHIGPDPEELEATLPTPSGVDSIANWGGYRMVPANRCDGYIDGFEPGVRQPGVAVAIGWAWDRQARRAPQKVVVTLPDGQVVGVGRMNIQREDVNAVVGEVTGINIGWEGTVAAARGSRLRAFALLQDGASICPLPNDVTMP
jgi:hypothetical protein